MRSGCAGAEGGTKGRGLQGTWLWGGCRVQGQESGQESGQGTRLSASSRCGYGELAARSRSLFRAWFCEPPGVVLGPQAGSALIASLALVQVFARPLSAFDVTMTKLGFLRLSYEKQDTLLKLLILSMAAVLCESAPGHRGWLLGLWGGTAPFLRSSFCSFVGHQAPVCLYSATSVNVVILLVSAL